MSSAAAEAVELCESVGLVLDPWQRTVLDAALGERVDGSWSAFEVGLLVARQNGKGSVLEARELAGLFLFGEELILHSAHDFKVAAEAFRRLLGWIEGSSDLRRRVRKVATANGKESIELRNGARIRYVARSKGGGRGFTGDLIVLDEAMILSQEAVAAMMPTLSARSNPQIWYTGSAPFAESQVWHNLRRRALDEIDSGNRSGRLAWCGWEAGPGDDPHDPTVWARTNPALGYRIGWDYLDAEHGALDADSFGRERLSLAEMAGVTHHMIDLVLWAQAADTRSTPAGRLVVAVDVAPGSVASAVGVAGARADGGRHVEVIQSADGTGWVVDRVAQIVDRNPDIGAVVLDPRSPAGGLLAALRARLTVPVVEVGAVDHGRAVSNLLQHVRSGTVSHVAQPVLDAAVAAARPRKLGDAQGFSRASSDANIAPLVAVTLALGYLEDQIGEHEMMPLDDMVVVV